MVGSASGRRRLLLAVTDPQSIRLIEGLPARIAADGWEVHIVVGAAVPDVPGCNVHVIPMHRDPRPVADVVSLVRWMGALRRIRPDVVLVGTPKAGLLGVVAAWLCRVPRRIYHLRGLRLETSTGTLLRLLTFLERVAMRCATDVLSVSPSLTEECVRLRLARREKLTTLGAGSSNGVDVTHFRPPSGDERSSAREALGWSTETPLVVGFVGRLTPEKGLDYLVEACEVAAGRVQFRLLLLGSEEKSGYVASLIGRLRVAGVECTHVAGAGDAARFYHAMDVLCLPSLREGLPNVVLEGAASGLPVVTTTATGCRDSVRDGETGWIAQVADSADLARCLLAALCDESARTRRGDAGRRWVERAFERGRVQGMVVSFLDDAVTAQGPAGSDPGRDPGGLDNDAKSVAGGAA